MTAFLSPTFVTPVVSHHKSLPGAIKTTDLGVSDYWLVSLTVAFLPGYEVSIVLA